MLLFEKQGELSLILLGLGHTDAKIMLVLKQSQHALRAGQACVELCLYSRVWPSAF